MGELRNSCRILVRGPEGKRTIFGSVHRELNLINVQQDAAYSVYYISVGSSTCFRC